MEECQQGGRDRLDYPGNFRPLAEETEMTPDVIQSIQYGALDGIVAGLLPLLIGFRHHRMALGLQGLLGTVLLGMYAGWLLAIPGAVYSTWRIVHDSIVAADGMDMPIATRMLRN